MNGRADIAPDERKILDWLAAQDEAMRALLEELVNIDSGSYNKAGVDRAGAAICRFLDRHEIGYEVVANDRFGNAIRASVGRRGDRNILLMGHRDTVFPDGEAGRRPFRAEDGRGYGPGAADMKAGLVMNCFVAAAFRQFGGAPAPLVVLITADEEIGSPSSRAVIETEARLARFVLNSEPGRPPNAIVTGRKAGIFMRFTISGKAAHSGANFEQGASAIGEMAHKIVALHALTDLAKGITVNVGVVQGGQTVNTVAPLAGGEVVPLVPTVDSKRLFETYAACARSLGLTVTGIFTGGCSDAGFSAAAGAPTICAVGPIGGRAHSPDEFVELASIVPRAQVLALTIMRAGESFP
jgi:glutamate carboxypeptidase